MANNFGFPAYAVVSESNQDEGTGTGDEVKLFHGSIQAP
jgi:hypothetical protein